MWCFCLRRGRGPGFHLHKGTVKRTTREEHHAQHLKPGGEGPFWLLMNRMLLKHYTGVPAALYFVDGFFRGVVYPEHSKTSLSHWQSIPNPLATKGSSRISVNLSSLVKYIKY